MSRTTMIQPTARMTVASAATAVLLAHDAIMAMRAGFVQPRGQAHEVDGCPSYELNDQEHAVTVAADVATLIGRDDLYEPIMEGCVDRQQIEDGQAPDWDRAEGAMCTLNRLLGAAEQIHGSDASLATAFHGVPESKDGTSVNWKLAKKRAEDHCASNPFPGIKPLARLVGCHPSVLKRAIDRSPKLRALVAEHKARGRSVSTVSMTEATLASAVQTREPNPSLHAETTEALFSRMLEDATPAERAKLNAMPPDQQRELVTLLAEDPAANYRVRGRARARR